MFRDTFEPAKPAGPRPAQTQAPLSPTEQAFWHRVRTSAELARRAEELKKQGRFEAVKASTGNYIYFRFQKNSADRSVGAEITPAAKPQQIENFFESCKKALSGAIEYANIQPYLPIRRRP